MYNEKRFKVVFDKSKCREGTFSRYNNLIANIVLISFLTLDIYAYMANILIPFFGLPPNILSFWLAIGAIFARVIIVIDQKREDVIGWELAFEILRFILFFIVAVSFLDLVFATYFLGNLFGMENYFDMILLNMIIALICIAIMSVIWLGFSGRMEEKSAALRFILPTGMLSVSIFSIILLLFYNNPINPLIMEEATLFTSNIPEGQSVYGGAEMFIYTFEMLFYSPIVAIMMGVMLVGTMSTIISVNLQGSQALKSFGTVTVVVPPLIMIWSIFIGAIAPPPLFVEILGGESLASFIYAITMISVFVILIMINAVFVQAADFFLPESEEKE